MRFFLRNKNVKNRAKRAKKLPILCCNCQIWANLIIFEIILVENWGGGKKYFGVGTPHAPVAPPL